MPELPVFRQLVWGNESTRLEVVADRVSTLSLPQLTALAPVQPSTLKSDERFFDAGYLAKSRLGFYSLPVATLRRVGRMGKRVLWCLEVSPVEYQLAGGLVKIHDIEYQLFSAESAPAPVRPVCYQVVAPVRFESTLRPLLQWRTQGGYEVGFLASDGLEPDSIRNWLKHKSPDFVLLVGDLGDLGSFSARHNLAGLNGHYADLYYGEYTNDYLPEAVVGRLPARDTAELALMVSKILGYELNPDSSTVARSLLVAGEEGTDPAPLTTNGQVNYVSGRLATLADTLCFRNPQSRQLKDSILTSLHRGFGLVNYTSHCDVYGWKRPDLTVADLASVSSNPGIWINNCCESNRFAGDCFGENLLRLPQGGAAAVIGAGNETLWVEDFYWSVGAKRPVNLYPAEDSSQMGAFDLLASHQIRTVGDLLLAGNMAVSASGSNNDAFYWEVYCLLGDPAMPVVVGVPEQLALSSSSVEVGDVRLRARATPGALVTVVQQGTLLGKAVAQSDSTVEVNLSAAVDSSQLTVTATKPYCIPAVIEASPSIPRGPKLTLTVENPSRLLGGSSVDSMRVVCRNVGVDTARMPIVVLTIDSSVSPNRILPVILRLAPMAPGQSDTLLIPVQVHEAHSATLAMAIGSAVHPDSVMQWIPVCWALDYRPIESKLQLRCGGRPVRRVTPRESYALDVHLDNASGWERDDIPVRVAVDAIPSGQLIEIDTVVSLLAHGGDSLCWHFSVPDVLQGLLVEVSTPDTSFAAWWLAGRSEESFEQSLGYPWINESPCQWMIDSTVAHQGGRSMRSGGITHSEHTELTIHIDLDVADTIGFWFKTSTQPDKDRLSFFVDKQQLNYWSGVKDWTYWKTVVMPGAHDLRWRYSKDPSVTSHDDCVWLDDVRLPNGKWPLVCGPLESVADTSLSLAVLAEAWVKVYPVPATTTCFIDCPVPAVVTIFDVAGRKVDQFEKINSTPTQYSTHRLRYGTYFVRCTTTQGAATLKLMVTR